jgi:transcriptional regulator with XRE-family HTH domain
MAERAHDSDMRDRPEECERDPQRLGGLLKRCRARLSPGSASIGTHLRLPTRIGKAVTQEEVAEAAGISRVWYGLLESGRAVRISASVLARIADALVMDPAERSAMFRLALPELRSTALANSSLEILDAIGALRRVMRPLWAASNEEEALTVVREHAMSLLSPVWTVTYTRVGEGRWDLSVTGDRDGGDGARQILAIVRERWGEAAADDVLGYTALAQPGEIMTGAERDSRFPDLAEKFRLAREAVGLASVSFAMANVRARDGIIRRLMASYRTAHAYSAFEREQLSTLADLTSFALSGCVSSRP